MNESIMQSRSKVRSYQRFGRPSCWWPADTCNPLGIRCCGLDSIRLIRLGEHVLIFGDGDDEQRASRHLFAGIANPQTSAK